MQTTRIKSTQPEQPVEKRRPVIRVIQLLLIAHLLYMLPAGFSLAKYIRTNEGKTWWQLSRASSDQAPDPSVFTDAVIQVYSARAARWRGALGVHTWIAVKPSNTDHYTRIEVIGFRLRRTGHSISIAQRSPDNYWFGSKPELLRDIRGGKTVDEMIQRLYEAIDQYPYDKRYRLWPGPNSNTFTAWLARALPELQLELPVTAIGKDYLPVYNPIASTPSGTGVQLSFGGLYGLMAGREEGIELTLLGFAAGIDFSPLAIKLPGIGRIGKSDFTADFKIKE